MSLACGGGDAGVREPGICGESLEEVHYRFEEGHSLGSLRTASWKAGSLKCAIACAMCSPFVLPKFLIGTIVVKPVLLHIIQSRSSTLRSEKLETGKCMVAGTF